MPIFKSRNENFFKKWSPEMAYVLGFFTADGNMIRNKRGAHFIEFTSTNKDLLQKIKKMICPDHKISVRERGGNWKPAYRIQIGSKKIYNDFEHLGLMERKSKRMNFPLIPEKYLAHYIRGYFDGDGSVTISTYKRTDRGGRLNRAILSGFICGSKQFIQGLYRRLRKFAKLTGGTLYYHDGGYRLTFSVKDSLALYNFMYSDVKNNLFLSRKKKKFEKYFKTT
ncbi:MAG: hypothetical protein AUJ32_03015 [Parcubacteria group bacterium CG1_02_40_82]|uniref:DOD-type homing endonuclease domain-containing protein n=4 Tax=Candidatus Portnoyibacteriota TaxID=1817913 RepID=A0A2M7IJ87_9BACT|nr:MAG: hypothetical protein AUJ32_03015 [Parcubacteria group bacterium CG1_02_40_82]PIQ75608.1 MAG: hypothetical protein COV84_00405 [Candidatus Portnoybacteria bacterium CG11_big_fil_rev_8_21_14_0_20_40_15]PIS31038.1 MAG: hypothetical protein COT41_02535 [Candidatus Portnoybacteria bacterium CG08_land_8_20_14_0_20_40_83]PIW76603.1 MAG: hypothetical protein CO001_00450 [Candidatus Portnoybacteria bacterium CG_4_8_14_3_um_filter_40_10]PIY75341.1 MAG: hypothetical protein COY85_00535 [Candidatus